MKKVLVIVDAQVDFIDGALANPAAEAALPAIGALVHEAVSEGAKIIYTKDTHYKNYLETHEGKNLPIPHTIFGTPGWEVPASIIADGYVNSFELQKNQFGADPDNWEYMLDDDYYDNDEYLDIHICGFVSSICVVSNALMLRALYPEADITFHAYASAGLTPEDHEAACKVMECCQIKVLREAA